MDLGGFVLTKRSLWMAPLRFYQGILPGRIGSNAFRPLVQINAQRSPAEVNMTANQTPHVAVNQIFTAAQAANKE